jgi:hypothetical protein
MMKQILILVVIAALGGIVYAFLTYDVQSQYAGGKWTGMKIVPKGSSVGPATDIPAGPFRPTIRIATFQLGRLDDAKMANRRASEVIVRLLSRFDLIALQGVRGKNHGVLIRLVEQLNAASGRNYNYATCPTQQRDALEHYSAFLFDQGRIEVDRSTVHFAEDRLGRIRLKPLVGLFRARGPAANEAFTFTLVNVETDPNRTAAELDVLTEVFKAVRDDGRGEDDVILLGDLESDDQHLGQLNRLLGVTPLVSGVPTTVRGANLLDNILLDRRATSEFTGRVEVVDMLREFDLPMTAAQEVSEHLPVWAEFSVYEGGQPGHPTATN